MSVEKVDAEVVKSETPSLKAEDLDKSKLAFISFGSLCGMGLGFLLSFVITNHWAKMFLGIGLLSFGFWSIMKALPLLRR